MNLNAMNWVDADVIAWQLRGHKEADAHAIYMYDIYILQVNAVANCGTTERDCDAI